MSLDKWFREPTEKPIPPDARRWEAKLRGGPKHQCVFDRKRDGLVFDPASLILLVKNEKDEIVDSLDTPWSSELNEWAIAKSIKCERFENEGERFGFAFQDRFGPVVLRYGDGFFNAVLTQHLREEELADVPTVRAMLNSIGPSRKPNDDSAVDCAQLIDLVIQDAAQDLTQKLQYPREEAGRILESAIAYYLDERFSITNAKLLFPNQD